MRPLLVHCSDLLSGSIVILSSCIYVQIVSWTNKQSRETSDTHHSAVLNCFMNKLDVTQSMILAQPAVPLRRLLIIVDWSVNGFACVQRSSCTFCRIPSNASVREMSEGKNVKGEMFVPRCTGVVNRNRRRSTSCITLTTVERVMTECTKFITLWSR